jgi:hypothetical protein
MPVHYTLDGTLFRMDFEGSYTTEEVKQVFAAALEDPAFPEDARLLMDVTQSTSLASRPAEEIQGVADFLGPRAARVGNRCAIYAREPVKFGLMRMAQVFGETHGVETSVFSELEPALEWLGAPRQAP